MWPDPIHPPPAPPEIRLSPGVGGSRGMQAWIGSPTHPLRIFTFARHTTFHNLIHSIGRELAAVPLVNATPPCAPEGGGSVHPSPHRFTSLSLTGQMIPYLLFALTVHALSSGDSWARPYGHFRSPPTPPEFMYACGALHSTISSPGDQAHPHCLISERLRPKCGRSSPPPAPGAHGVRAVLPLRVHPQAERRPLHRRLRLQHGAHPLHCNEMVRRLGPHML